MTRFIFFVTFLIASCMPARKSSDTSPEQPSVVQQQNTGANPASTPSPTPSSTPSPSPPPSPIIVPQDPSVSSNLIPNFHRVNSNIFRGGRPTKNGVAAIAKLGVKTILSVQDYGWDKDDADEEKNWAASANIKFLHVPMHGLKKPTLEQIHAALSYLNDVSNYPMLVHCEKGSDRTGIVVASYHIKSDGWDVAKATAEMYDYGHSRWLSWWDSILKSI